MRVKFGVDAEVKKCPFCGKEPKFYFSPISNSLLEIILQCPKKCAGQHEFIKEDEYGYFYSHIDETCKKIIKKWNTREKE